MGEFQVWDEVFGASINVCHSTHIRVRKPNSSWWECQTCGKKWQQRSSKK